MFWATMGLCDHSIWLQRGKEPRFCAKDVEQQWWKHRHEQKNDLLWSRMGGRRMEILGWRISEFPFPKRHVSSIWEYLTRDIELTRLSSTGVPLKVSDVLGDGSRLASLLYTARVFFFSSPVLLYFCEWPSIHCCGKTSAKESHWTG